MVLRPQGHGVFCGNLNMRNDNFPYILSLLTPDLHINVFASWNIDEVFIINGLRNVES